MFKRLRNLLIAFLFFIIPYGKIRKKHRAPDNKEQKNSRKRGAGDRQKYAQRSHAKHLKQQKSCVLFQIISVIHFLSHPTPYPFLGIVRIKFSRGVPSSLFLILERLTFSIFSSTNNLFSHRQEINSSLSINRG